MRSDLNKLLCEHERYGSKRGYKEVRRDRTFDLYDEDGPIGNREGMRWRYKFHWNEKEFGENLNPLYGIIRKNVGRKWDDIFSELCQVFDTRSVINRHILIHLDGMVEINNIFFEDGELWIRSNYSGTRLLKDDGTEYYVDPRDGVLYRNEAYRSWGYNRRKIAEERRLERWKTYRNYGEFAYAKDEKTGTWYRYDYEALKPGVIEGYWETYGNLAKPLWLERTVGGYGFDQFLGETVQWSKGGWNAKRHPDCPANTIHVNKKTASKKEIKKYQLA